MFHEYFYVFELYYSTLSIIIIIVSTRLLAKSHRLQWALESLLFQILVFPWLIIVYFHLKACKVLKISIYLQITYSCLMFRCCNIHFTIVYC